VFDPGQVGQDRSGLDPARLVVASLTGAARRHAGWEEPTESETAGLRVRLPRWPRCWQDHGSW